MTLLERRSSPAPKPALRARESPRRSGGGPAWTLHHIPALDGIRGLAVIAVLLFHGDVLLGGYLGVDAFFVLSGFLITALLLSEVARTQRVNLTMFWIRRARRLLPALLVVLLGVALFAVFVAPSSELGRIRGDALATLGYFANWHSITQDNGYWSLFQAPSPLAHTWSLAIEEQFYLLWPLVVSAIAWFATRSVRGDRASVGPRTARRVLVLCGALVAASATWMAILVEPGEDTSRAYFGTDTRVASILIGAALAAFLTLRGPVRSVRGRAALEVAGLGALIGLGVAWATVDGQSTGLYRGGFFLCGVGVATVIAAAAHPRSGPLGKLLSLKPLCAVGVISYGLYLWHWPIYLVLTEARTGLDGWALLGCRVALSTVIAAISYVVVEQPIRRGSMSARRLLVVAPATALVCVLAIVVTTAGATAPTSGPVLVSPEPGRSSTGGGAAADSGMRMLVVGDSVASGIGEAAQGLEHRDGLTASSAALPGCLLEDQVPARAIIHGAISPLEPGHTCLPTWETARRSVAPSDVVIIFGSAGSFQDLELAGTWASPCDPAYRSWYVPRFRSAVNRFAKGASVAVVRLPHVTNDWAPPDADERIDCINAMNARVARSIDGVRTLNLASLVCPGGSCREVIDGTKYRVDGMHYSPEAATEVARWLVKKTLDARIDIDSTSAP